MPILDLCLETERWKGARVVKRWREQEGINFTGAWEAAEAADTG